MTRESVYWFIKAGPYLLKAHHIAAFAVHVILVWLWARRRLRSRLLRPVVPMLASFTLGIVIEIAQTLVPYRHPDTSDLVDDFLGIAFGYLTILVVAFIRRLVRRTGVGLREVKDVPPEPKEI